MQASPIAEPTQPGATQWHLTLHSATDEFRRAAAARDDAIVSTLEAHLAWNRERHLDGRILFSGPNMQTMMGIIVYGRLSTEEVESDLETEPFIAAGWRTVEVIQWDVHQIMGIGSFALPPAYARPG